MPLTADKIASLYDAHGPDVLRYFARRTFDPEAALDLLAETFARAIADRERFRGGRDEEAIGWIYSIARNQLTDFIRRGRVERAAMARLGVVMRAPTESELDRVEQLIDLRELRDPVALALDELPSSHQEILRLRVIEERTYKELADHLGISEDSARARVSRALRALRGMPSITQLQEQHDHA